MIAVQKDSGYITEGDIIFSSSQNKFVTVIKAKQRSGSHHYFSVETNGNNNEQMTIENGIFYTALVPMPKEFGERRFI